MSFAADWTIIQPPNDDCTFTPACWATVSAAEPHGTPPIYKMFCMTRLVIPSPSTGVLVSKATLNLLRKLVTVTLCHPPSQISPDEGATLTESCTLDVTYRTSIRFCANWIANVVVGPYANRSNPEDNWVRNINVKLNKSLVSMSAFCESTAT